jgi:F420-dependent oxidoreductase-like protein
VANYSIMIEGQQGVNWPRWKRLAAEVEQLGFVGLFRSDHFTDAQPPNQDALELMISLSYLAAQTQRIHFGSLVAPVSFRDPIMLARQAAAIDDLSGGRLILGVGAGWQEREHHLFGYGLGDVPARFQRLEEALVVMTRLFRHDTPVPYEGRFFQLREGASLLPRPARPGGPRIMIGGNGPLRTLPLAARYADVWNAVWVSVDDFRARSAKLDELAQAAGRSPSDIRRTVMVGVVVARDLAELERLLAPRRAHPELAGKSLDEVVAALRKRNMIVGLVEEIREQLEPYAAAGAEEFMLQWLELDDIDRLRALGRALGK